MDDRTLKRVLDAFNRHDLDSIMSFFTEDCGFHMPRGTPRKDSFWKIVERE